ncbi:hypothetical protein EWM62_09250 [Mucilaginibacter terrigena]|uniref:Lipocalin-like domain-containing protein n=1 Tax=Mucilaginibacter terrigena TaxID=2492395 RepID=A0A4Q5LMJ3_9SPHI|nr:DUF5004 domain-containing protein [Mucilaginibacter terrigena]RYU90817.1 hypothetical protein EWM62_09250 [Mucilaginibacter terrigena]
MKKRNLYFLLAGLLVISFFANSCKKEKQSSIAGLLTYGKWQLGTVMEYKYLGDSQQSVDTLECDSAQIFVFNDDKTCSYTNFDCAPATVNGTWSLSDNKLFLFADITYPEITSAHTKQPFINSRIANLGEFSMVLETGDLQTYYTATDNRTIRRYGFTRIKPVVTK